MVAPDDIPFWRKVLGILLLPVFAVIILLLALIAVLLKPFAKPEKRTPREVAACLRAFLGGTGDDWDWDDFTSLRIADPELESIRMRARALDLPPDEAGEAELRALIVEAETIAARDQAALLVSIPSPTEPSL